ncbi:translocation/assembly module TamB domain-containing protein [Taibaiella soli]|uniref:translocation/assembly module TamB domain-containing protein n=1 Tax=Taibaiella soli TaxID=1649169 RepID=UPI000F4F9D16|nr:translocation/assembly module TamB domain-containing protein [Taibaiella soli]
MEIRHVRVDFLNHVLLEGIYIQDHQQDTLLYADLVQTRITDWFFLKKEVPVISYVGLHGAYANLYRKKNSAEWNYQFIIDAFSGPKKSTGKKSDFEIDLKKVDLKNVRFRMDDAWEGVNMDFDVGSLDVDADKVDLKKKLLDVNNIDLKQFSMVYYDYEAGKPKDPNRKKKKKEIDTTAFNTGNWLVSLKKLQLDDCAFHFKSDEDIPAINEFDPAHMDITGINIDVRNIHILKDTIRGRMYHLAAKERCGIEIKDFKAAITVSPNASICDSLYLETNHSKLQNYYAMHYTRFPDFTDYIEKVIMVGRLKNATVDARDVAYFAPQLRKLYPATLKVSGSAVGTVADLKAKDLDVTDGTSTIKGDLSMKGLPDIYTTFIDFDNGEIMTSGQAILKYAPELKQNPNVDVQSLKYAYFKGSYKGYLENFATSGTLTTNLGTIVSDIKLSLPDSKKKTASYAGTIKGDKINAGVFFRQPDLGTMTFNATVNGSDFDPHNAHVNINTTFAQLYYHQYNYTNITAEGVLAKKQFTGQLLVDDPNLALAFNGNIDFSQPLPVIKATANLLKSNLHALHLTKDSIMASADFDLNSTGNTIDNFLGSAKLYNINVIRNKNRLDLDSVYINSSAYDDTKTFTLQSNDITAHIVGKYELSKLPPSLQYYLAGYLPAYIKKPKNAAPNQIISFDVTTRDVDNLLSVVVPQLRNFNNATIIGSLNTTTQELILNAQIPEGHIDNVALGHIEINATGNYQQLSVKTDIAAVVVSDSLVNVSLNANATLGNDSLRFNIVTSSPLSYGTAIINGHAYAYNDSLYLNILPSEFYLGQNKWQIDGDNRIVFAKKYLDIDNLHLHSGFQELMVNTQSTPQSQEMSAEVKNLDLATLGGIAGLSAYQPDGRLTGNITVRDLFTKTYATANLLATDLKLGADTVGEVHIIGNYDAVKKQIELQQETGIYNGNASLTANGIFSLDSAHYQALNGQIKFNHASLAWISPFVTGLMSDLGGYADGSVQIKGTSLQPDISGQIKLDSASLHVDYLGTNYTIPTGVIDVNNQGIKSDQLTLYDQHGGQAIFKGGVTHDHLRNFKFAMSASSSSFEVLNLRDFENANFYGQVLADFSLRATGPFDDITLSVRGAASKPSHLYIPITTTGNTGSYSYVSFQTYGNDQTIVKKKKGIKYNISIDAQMTDNLETTMILDPATGDEINAKGNGSLNIRIASNADMSITGAYVIDEGDYTFTFRQLFFKRKFIINRGSSIVFTGPVTRLNLDIEGTYRTMARLYDLLSEQEQQNQMIPSSELADAKTAQNVDVILHMKGSLQKPELTFKLELPEKRSVGTYAYTKLERINQNDRELFDQVASLLLVGTFIPPEGLIGTTAKTGAINNMSEIISTTASSQLTNIVNKLLGDKSLAVELKYKNYNLSDPTVAGGINRNELRFGVRQSLFKERVIVEVGSIYDWGRPTSTNTSTSSALTLAGDFRVQYLVTEDGRLRLNGFRTNNFDVAVGSYITRAGVGISWRKTFDNMKEFFHGVQYSNYIQKQTDRKLMKIDSTTIKKAE